MAEDDHTKKGRVTEKQTKKPIIGLNQQNIPQVQRKLIISDVFFLIW